MPKKCTGVENPSRNSIITRTLTQCHGTVLATIRMFLVFCTPQLLLSNICTPQLLLLAFETCSGYRRDCHEMACGSPLLSVPLSIHPQIFSGVTVKCEWKRYSDPHLAEDSMDQICRSSSKKSPLYKPSDASSGTTYRAVKNVWCG